MTWEQIEAIEAISIQIGYARQVVGLVWEHYSEVISQENDERYNALIMVENTLKEAGEALEVLVNKACQESRASQGGTGIPGRKGQ